MFQRDAKQNSQGIETVQHRRQVVQVAVIFVALPVLTD